MKHFFILDKTIEVNLPKEEIKNRINTIKNSSYSYNWKNRDLIKFNSKLSFGTLIVKGLPNASPGIQLFGELKSVKNNKAHIRLFTKFRSEYILITVFFFVVLFMDLFGYEEVPIGPYFLFPGLILWFRFIYFAQEKILLKEVLSDIKQKLK
jgi:hypothetical protein